MFLHFLRVNAIFLVNEYDAEFDPKIISRPVNPVNGSGFSNTEFKTQNPKTTYKVNYLARFSDRKYRDQIVKLAQHLPPIMSFFTGNL